MAGERAGADGAACAASRIAGGIVSLFGPWIERLEAIAVAREMVAVAGWRDAQGVTESAAHVIPVSLLDGKGTGWSLAARAPIRALAFAGEELLISGSDD